MHIALYKPLCKFTHWFIQRYMYMGQPFPVNGSIQFGPYILHEEINAFQFTLCCFCILSCHEPVSIKLKNKNFSRFTTDTSRSSNFF